MTETYLETLRSDLNRHYFNISNINFEDDMDERCINSNELSKRRVVRPMHLIEIKKPDSLVSGSTSDSEQLSYRSFAPEETEPQINEVLFKKHRPKISKNSSVQENLNYDEFFEYYVDHYIPAILLTPPTACGRLFIYYHANAEDIGLAYSFCKDLNKKLDVDSSHPVLHAHCRVSRL